MTVLKSADRSDILIIAATVFALLLSAGLLVFGILHADDIDEQRTDALPGIGTAYAEQFFDDSFVHTVNLMIPEQYLKMFMIISIPPRRMSMFPVTRK